MIAGLTTLNLISAPHFHERLTAVTADLTRRLAEAARRADVALATNQVGGMFGFFFTSEPNVDRFSKVMDCDVERFKRFFHGMLAEGIYFAPSAFEAGFVSAAHTPADIDTTIAAANRVFDQHR
jgi:glutamate-1-semialdehyde 2,1-aminomutase